jgi:hypothetical protein
MYSTCIFCNHSLGANRRIEHFPVGGRLAFDGAKGRLWAVCTACHRWNLSPLEERWEAIEDCERLFRGTLVRVSTDNIGMARLAEARADRIGSRCAPNSPRGDTAVIWDETASRAGDRRTGWREQQSPPLRWSDDRAGPRTRRHFDHCRTRPHDGDGRVPMVGILSPRPHSPSSHA